MAALDGLLGPADDSVLHATIPFDLGADIGGGADVVVFHPPDGGVLYVTAELIGNEDQPPSSLGAYELAIAHDEDNDWGPDLISRLAYYTLRAVLEPGSTMDIRSALPDESTLAALLFSQLGSFAVQGKPAGALLCIGITASELRHARKSGGASLERKLRAANVFPFTRFQRAAVV